jgi:hypothetical protein
LALADPRPMSLKEKQRMTQFTLRPHRFFFDKFSVAIQCSAR